MSLAFQRAGYEVLLACEGDRKSYDIYSRNFNSNIVCESILDKDIYSLSESDVIAGKLEMSEFWIRKLQTNYQIDDWCYKFVGFIIGGSTVSLFHLHRLGSAEN